LYLFVPSASIQNGGSQLAGFGVAPGDPATESVVSGDGRAACGTVARADGSGMPVHLFEGPEFAVGREPGFVAKSTSVPVAPGRGMTGIHPAEACAGGD
jgi:hypothetical protein